MLQIRKTGYKMMLEVGMTSCSISVAVFGYTSLFFIFEAIMIIGMCMIEEKKMRSQADFATKIRGVNNFFYPKVGTELEIEKISKDIDNFDIR